MNLPGLLFLLTAAALIGWLDGRTLKRAGRRRDYYAYLGVLAVTVAVGAYFLLGFTLPRHNIQ